MRTLSAAVHEAAHAVVCWAQGGTVLFVQVHAKPPPGVVPLHPVEGLCKSVPFTKPGTITGPVHLTSNEYYRLVKDAAVVFSGCLAQASATNRSVQSAFQDHGGIGDAFKVHQLAQLVRPEFREIFYSQARGKSLDLVREHWEDISVVAAYLMDKGVATGDEVDCICQGWIPLPLERIRDLVGTAMRFCEPKLIDAPKSKTAASQVSLFDLDDLHPAPANDRRGS